MLLFILKCVPSSDMIRSKSAFRYFINVLPVLRFIDAIGRSPQNRIPHIRHRFDELDGGLAAELTDDPPRLFVLQNTGDIICGQRFKVQAVRNVKVRGHRFRIVVDDHRFVAQPPPRGTSRTGSRTFVILRAL